MILNCECRVDDVSDKFDFVFVEAIEMFEAKKIYCTKLQSFAYDFRNCFVHKNILDDFDVR